MLQYCKKLHAGDFYTCDFSTEQYRNDLSGTQAPGTLVNLLYLSEMVFLEEFVWILIQHVDISEHYKEKVSGLLLVVVLNKNMVKKGSLEDENRCN